jgi:hypothetical protein
MKYHEALKMWNAHKKTINAAHVWALPKKGTAEHSEVLEIQKSGAPLGTKERSERLERATAKKRVQKALLQAVFKKRVKKAEAKKADDKKVAPYKNKGKDKDAFITLMNENVHQLAGGEGFGYFFEESSKDALGKYVRAAPDSPVRSRVNKMVMEKRKRRPESSRLYDAGHYLSEADYHAILDAIDAM